MAHLREVMNVIAANRRSQRTVSLVMKAYCQGEGCAKLLIPRLCRPIGGKGRAVEDDQGLVKRVERSRGAG
jgi:hypothetical protein